MSVLDAIARLYDATHGRHWPGTQNKISSILGQPGAPAGPMQTITDPNSGMMTQFSDPAAGGYGLAGGEYSPAEAAMRLSVLPGVNQHLNQLAVNQTNIERQRMINEAKMNAPHHTIGGVEGQPSMRQPGYFSPSTGEWTPYAPAYEHGAQTEVNIAGGNEDIVLDPTDVMKFRNERGEAPAHLIGVKNGPQLALKQGYKMVGAAGEKQQMQYQKLEQMFNDANDMLFGEGGIYTDYGTDFSKSLPDWAAPYADKISETAEANWQNLIQIDPRYNEYNSFSESRLSGAARAFGEVGNLAEGDVERARGLFPQLKGMNIDTPAVAKAKLDGFQRIIDYAKSNEQTGNFSKSNPAPEIEDLSWESGGYMWRMHPETGKLQRGRKVQ